MNTCAGCGAENTPGLARCEYCGKALATSQVVLVSWEGRTQEGAVGRGIVRVTAPAGADDDRVRAAAEAAFSAAVDELGLRANQSRLQEALHERLVRLLPADHELVELTLDDYTPPGRSSSRQEAVVTAAAVARTGGGLAVLGVATLITGFSLLCALGGYLAISEAGEQTALVSRAQVLSPAAVLEADGPVCLEAVTTSAAQPVLAGTKRVPCLFLETKLERQPQGKAKKTETKTEHVDAFQVDEVPVQVTAKTRFVAEDLADLGEEQQDGGTVRWRGIKVGDPVTLVGTVAKGTLTAHVVSTQADRSALMEHIQGKARTGRVLLVLGLAVGLIVFLGGCVMAFLIARRRKR